MQGVFILLFHVVLNERAKQELFKTARKTFKRVRAWVGGQPYESSQSASKDSDGSSAVAARVGASVVDGDASHVDMNANSSSMATVSTVMDSDCKDEEDERRREGSCIKTASRFKL